MPVFDPRFLKPTFTPPIIPQKIKINKGDVYLQFMLAKDIGPTYKVEFLIQLNPIEKTRDPSLMLSPSSIDMESLKNAILDSINPYDKKYMILNQYDTRKAIFHLDSDKWFNDCLSTVNPVTHLSKFNRVFRLKARVPLMILADPLSKIFGDFVVKKFKEYMEKKNKEGYWFKYLFPTSAARSRMRSRVRNMFDWEYDQQWNTVTATLKPIYIMGLLFSVGALAKKISDRDVKNRNIEFSQRVQQNLKSFDLKKFEKFVSRKGFV